MSDRIKIIICTHKECEMPKDPMYLLLHVGAAGKMNPDGTAVDFGYTRDDTGDNISSRNSNFGTQTGLYWLWKNVDAEYKGLVHYRRYFVGKNHNKNDMLGSVITTEEIEPMLSTYKVFVPHKRRYYIETLYSHYEHTHDSTQLDFIREQIRNRYPDYLTSFDRVMKRKWGYMFNMMILQKDLMNEYCSWLFDLLFSLYGYVDQSNMSAFDKRFCGRVSELLFDVWLEYELENGFVENKDIRELSIMEDVQWGKKIKSFLSAKFLGKKYKASALVKNNGR